jgi:hypothetical protein
MNSKKMQAEPTNTAEDWESGALGQSEEYVKVAGGKISSEIDEALGLQMISIRLSKGLIESYKLLGAKHGMGYQPLMREALKRFADGELKNALREQLESQKRDAMNAKIEDKPAPHKKAA